MKQVRFAIFLFVALAVAAGVLLWSGLLTRPIIDAISKQLEADTGYRLSVNGPVRVQIVPSLEVAAEDVAIVPTSGPGRDELVRVSQVRFALSRESLLGGRVHAKEIALKQPVLRLVAEGDASPSGASKAGQADTLQNFAFDRVQVEDGTLIYRDPRENAEIKVENIQFVAAARSEKGAVDIDGRGRWGDRPLRGMAKIGSLALLVAGKPTTIDVAMKNDRTEETFVSFAADMKIAGRTLTLDGLVGTTGRDRFSGFASVDWSKAKPYVVTELSADRVEVGVSGAQPAARGAPATAPQPWDSRPIDLSGLRLVNVAAKLTVKELVLANARIVPGPIDATIFDGVLSVSIVDARTYGGNGQGRLVVDASQELPRYSVRLSLMKVGAAPLLIDVFTFPHLAGQMQAHAVFHSKGDSPAAIAAALDGTAKVLIENGTIEGLENMIGAVPMNIWQAWSGASEKTAFGTFGATFNLANGQAATEDLVLDGPYLRANGRGSVNFASKSVDFNVEPTVIVSRNNANRDANAIRLGVPVTIRGPWNNPQVGAQLANINPDAANRAIQALTEGLFSSPDKSGSLDSVMKGMREMLERGTMNRAPTRDPTQPAPPARTAPTPGADARRDSAPAAPSTEETPAAKQMQESIQSILKDLLKDR